MVNLGDFFGLIMSEFSIARAQNDAEALRISEFYASHTKLKHFPVARFRISNAEFEVPVAIAKSGDVKPGEILRGEINFGKIKTEIKNIIIENIRTSEIKLTERQMTSLLKVLGNKVDQMKLNVESRYSTKFISSELAEDLFDEVTKLDRNVKAESLMKFKRKIKDLLSTKLLQYKELPPRLQVLVTTQEIREAGDNVMKINLSISEEAIEWTTIQKDGYTEDKLVPE